MKPFRVISLISALLLAASSLCGQQRSLDLLLKELGQTIIDSDIYLAAKQARIDLLKEKLAATDPESVEIYDVNRQLIKEYESYQADSTLKLLNANIEWAERHGDRIRADQSRISLFQHLSMMGYYAEAKDIIAELDRSTLDKSLLADYYLAHYTFYNEVLYSPDVKVYKRYNMNRLTYRDSLLSVYDRNQPNPDYATMSWLLYGWDISTEEAMAIHKKLLAETELYSHQYAKLANRVASLYRRDNRIDEEMEYLTLTVIADIRSGVRDQGAITMLAKDLFEQGRTDKAYELIQFAWKKSSEFNSRMRLRNNAAVMSIVDKHQHDLIKLHNSRIRLYNSIISFALAMLALALWFVYRNNRELKKVQGELKIANEQLGQENEKLSDANKLKLALVTQFMMQCSSHIKSLDSWRKKVYGKIVKGKGLDLLDVSSTGDLGRELDEFYYNFDSAFLQMYPDFVRRFNELLQEGEQIIPKEGELLTPELRIFALIHLGISDSSQIAELLYYSVNTIYNYRAKVKNKACVSRDQFESLVAKIK